MIVKLKNGKWRLKSKAGKNLGTFDSREAAEKHEREVEYFKKQGTQNMKPSFKQLSVNLVGPQVRQDKMEGRDWTVVPMIMAVEGVLHGSDGPLFYPGEELAKNPFVWNHKPVVVYHPELNGQQLSACDPTILTEQKIGVIMNTEYVEEEKGGKTVGKLKAEAWLDPERLDVVDDRISKAIANKKTLELSTGLFLDVDPADGEFNGVKYAGIARNYKPDHLAVLPDKVGACSVKDGAGFLRANQDNLPDTAYLFVDGDKRYCQVRNAEGSVDETLLETAIGEIPELDLPEGRRAGMMFRAKQMLRKAKATGNAKKTTEVSHETIREALLTAIRTEKGPYRYIVDVFDTSFVYSEDGGGMYQQDYALKDGVVSVSGLPTRVVRKYQYVQVANKRIVRNVQYEECPMNKEQMIAKLIANGQWSDGDKETLSALSEEALQQLVKAAEAKPEPKAEEKPKANEKKEEPKPVEPKPVTLNDYIASAPAEVQEVLNQSLRIHKQTRDGMIAKIKANARNKFSDEQLEAMGLDALEAIAALAVEEEEPVANFAGLAPVVTANTEEALQLPTWDFSKK